MELKIVILSQGMNDAQFYGPGILYAVAFHGNVKDKSEFRAGRDYFLSAVSLPPSQKFDRERVGASAREALGNLAAKLGPNAHVQAVLSTEGFFKDFKAFGKKVLIVPFDSRPAECKAAERIAQRNFTARQDLFFEEHPFVPGLADAATPEGLGEHCQALQHPGADLAYDVTHPRLRDAWIEATRRKKMLLHICCGPDAAGVINQLKRDFDVTCFWYDPNIQPRAEHDLRLDAFKKVAEIEKVPFIEGEYDVARFLDEIKGLEHTPEQGAKCSVCYDLRLERSAFEAKRLGFDYYSTTLAISPHKVQEKLKSFGILNEKKYGVPYYAKNFMRDEGFKKSVEYTRDYDIYRQDYCGCWFSLHEGGAQARSEAQRLNLDLETITERKFVIPNDP